MSLQPAARKLHEARQEYYAARTHIGKSSNIIHFIILQSVLQVHCLFQSELSTQFDLVLNLSIFSIPSFP